MLYFSKCRYEEKFMKNACLAVVGVLLVGYLLAGTDGFPDIKPAKGWDTLSPAIAEKGDWPWWRGPNSDHVVSQATHPPTVWGADSGIQWKVTLPGIGHSSPILCGNKIYVTSGDLNQGAIWLLCVDPDSGEVIWKSEVYQGAVAKLHKDNSLASSTPAFDGERIFVPYQTDKAVGVAALNQKGKLLWRTVLAPYTTVQGYSASPVFYKSLVILPVEAKEGSRMVAVHRSTGKVVWRNTMRKVKESYATPLVAHVAGRDQLLLAGGESTRGYNPATGAKLWECEGPSTYCGATPVADKESVDGSWKSDKKAGYVPSPVLYEGLIYAVNDQGLMRCYDAADGQVQWEEPLKKPFYSSPVIAGGLIYLFDRKGLGIVMKTGRKKKIVASNTLPAGVFASPVFKGERMYLRTLGDFYCIGR
jgi:outer membrane protein assembly factor BamB